MFKSISILFVVLFICSKSYADLCDETDSMADAVLYMPDVHEFREKMASVVSETNVNEHIHADLIDKYSDLSEYRGQIHDMYVNLLEAEYSCDEIAAASEYLSSSYGKEFFKKLYPLYTKIGVGYGDIIEERMGELAIEVDIRNQKIIEYLPKIKEIEPPYMVSIVVANRSLAAGAEINSDTVAVREIPSRYYSSFYVKPGEYEDKLKGKTLTKNLSKGDPVLESFLK